MTEIEKTEGEIKVLQAKLELLKELENHKTPCEEAYKRVYGFYPETYEDSWSSFQDGYIASQKDYKVGEFQPTPQTPEQVEQGLKEAFREAVKQGVVSSSTKSQTLYEILWEWWEDLEDTLDMDSSIDYLVSRIENWLPTEHETNSYKWNECIRMIREKLR
jgi:hypothetical protein